MAEATHQSYSRADVIEAASGREPTESARAAAGAALTKLGVPLTRADVGILANRMLDALAEGIHSRPREDGYEEPAPPPDRLPVTRDQAIRLFSEARVIDVEMVDELAAWTFAGGIVLVLNHATEPPEFTLGLDATDG